MATVTVDVKYDEGLVKCIQELFIHKIVPENFLITVHKYDSNVLTMADVQRLRKMLESKSSLEVNYDVLCTMKNYRGWFNVILDVCQDSEVKQVYLVDAFKQLKSKFDKAWFSHLAQEDNLVSKLENLSLDSKSKNELEADGGAVCSTPARKSDTVNASESSMNDQNGAKVCCIMNNGKGYCYACCVELTSEKFKDGHIAGKNHLKKMKEKGFNTNFDEAKSVEAIAEKGFNSSFDEAKSAQAISQKGFNSSFDEAKSAQAISQKGFDSSFDEAKSAQAISEKGFNSSFDETRSVEAISEKGFNFSYDDAKSFEETVADSDSFSEDWIRRCHICNLPPFTSAQHSRQHMDGSKHKKKVEASLKVNTPKPTPTLGPNGEVRSVNDLGVGMCYLCGVSITSKENANLHFNGKKHKNMCKENGLSE